jgi:cytoskeletal protein CcmA (bactofilin family)
MFKKSAKMEIDQQTISSIISEGCVLEGSFKAPAFARIDGQVIGDITIEQGLILGEKGHIKGNINTKQMVVYGYVEGNISVESLEVRSTGKINGDIKTGTIQVEAGAVYNGNLSMA